MSSIYVKAFFWEEIEIQEIANDLINTPEEFCNLESINLRTQSTNETH